MKQNEKQLPKLKHVTSLNNLSNAKGNKVKHVISLTNLPSAKGDEMQQAQAHL